MAKRVHSREFKLEAVRLVRDQKLPVVRVARELGVHPNSLRDWIKKYEQDLEQASPGHGQMKPLRAVIWARTTRRSCATGQLEGPEAR
jgi:transposase